MVKLGKKARKFAKKHLPSVLKHRRRFKAMLKRKASSRYHLDAAKDEAAEQEIPSERNTDLDDIGGTSLDAVFSDDESEIDRDVSDSDGYLSEGSSCPSVADSESDTYLDKSEGSAFSVQNRKIHLELAKQKKKLDRLKTKDPKFAKFLETQNKELESCRIEETDSDEGETSDGMQSMKESDSNLSTDKILTSSCVKSWIQLAMEQHDLSALAKLLNGYWTACNYSNQSAGGRDTVSCRRIPNSEAFCNILMSMLQNADNVFRMLLGISCSNCRKDMIMELTKTSKWETVKPLIKSYLRSTLVLLNQVSVHLWATGQGTLSLCSLLIIKDVAKIYNSDCFGTCLIKTYKAFIGQCTTVEPGNIKHIQFLRDSYVELCSMDVRKSISNALVSIQQLARILQHGLQAKKETIKTICSWQYVNCVDLWVVFMSMNAREYDLQALLFMVIQIIKGVAKLFPGPRYLPLRFRCIQWLNSLSSSSGVFIPVVSLVLDMLECNIGKEGGSSGNFSSLSCNLKLPKHWLKSQDFQEYCAVSAIELLCVHFAQWSYHISFPDLATIPLICMRRFYKKVPVESLRRLVKRFIDQVEQNVGYVQRKRDEVPFSPKDQQSVESFLQLEKGSGDVSFTQYYRSVIEKASSRNLGLNGKKSPKHKRSGTRREEKVGLNGDIESEKRKPDLSADDGEIRREGKKPKKV